MRPVTAYVAALFVAAFVFWIILPSPVAPSVTNTGRGLEQLPVVAAFACGFALVAGGMVWAYFTRPKDEDIDGRPPPARLTLLVLTRVVFIALALAVSVAVFFGAFCSTIYREKELNRLFVWPEWDILRWTPPVAFVSLAVSLAVFLVLVRLSRPLMKRDEPDSRPDDRGGNNEPPRSTDSPPTGGTGIKLPPGITNRPPPDPGV